MKKLLSFVFMIAMTQAVVAYFPQNGPLVLGDNTLNGATNSGRGIIMNTLLTNPDFIQDVNNVYQFLGIPRTVCLPSYEEIVDTMNLSIYSPGVISVIEAFEKAIMRYLHYNHYICFTEGKIINIFFTGIKYNWFYPSEWIDSANWLSSNNSAEVAQLINELEQLANIASKHSLTTALRLQAKIDSYRSWKQNTAISMATFSTISACAYYVLKQQIDDHVSLLIKQIRLLDR